MKCSEFRDYLDDYCRERLEKDIILQLESHMASCKACEAQFNEHSSLLSLLAREPELEVDQSELADFLPGVWDKIESEKKFSLKGWFRKLVPAAAAAIMFGFMIFRPAINTVTFSLADLEDAEIGYSSITSDYYLVDIDTIYTDDYYGDILTELFADEDTVSLDIFEEQIYSDAGLFSESTLDLSTLSDEDLDKLDEKLLEILNNAG